LRPQVDDYIEDPTPGAPYDLGFFMRSSLEMKSTHRPAMPIRGKAFLGDIGIEASRCELVSAPDAGEEAALILSGLEVD